MVMTGVVPLALGFLGAALAIHLASIFIVLVRLRRVARDGPPPVASPVASPAAGVTVLRPVRGLDFEIGDTLRSSFELDYPDYEVLFCVQSPDDRVVPLVRRLMADYPDVKARLLIGDERVSDNPKLNNLVKGWEAASYDWIVMSDSNEILPPAFIETLQACWDGQTGLVSGPAVGVHPIGAWGRLECAFLNTHEARWQLAADEVGLGFAQGKTLFWRRDILEDNGGLRVLGTDLAEDVAATKLVRRAGLKVRVIKRPFGQPIGRRKFSEVWQRQLRWARLRRLGFLAFFLPEIVSGGAAPLVAALVLFFAGAVPLVSVAVFGALWYGAEFGLARAAEWPARPRDALLWILRDMMIPLLWVAAWGGDKIEWRGNQFPVRPEAER